MAVIYSWFSTIWASKHMMSIPDVRCKRVNLFCDTVATAEFLCQNVSCMMIFKSKSEGVGEETVYVTIFTCRYWQQAWIPQSRESVVRCVTVAQANLILRNFPQSQMADCVVYLNTRLQFWFLSPLRWTILWRNTAWILTYLAGLWQDLQYNASIRGQVLAEIKDK